MRMLILSTLLAATASMPVPSAAPQGTPMAEDPGMDPVRTRGVRVRGWRARFDRPDVDIRQLFFRGMNGGLHISTREPAILWNPINRTADAYSVSASFALLALKQGQHAYGVFVGGRNLTSRTPHFVSFMVRQDGSAAVEQAGAAGLVRVMSWTAIAAVNSPDEVGNIANVLSAEVGNGRVRFLVNNQSVFEDSVSRLPSDGIAGLRVLSGTDAHIYYFRLISTR